MASVKVASSNPMLILLPCRKSCRQLWTSCVSASKIPLVKKFFNVQVAQPDSQYKIRCAMRPLLSRLMPRRTAGADCLTRRTAARTLIGMESDSPGSLKQKDSKHYPYPGVDYFRRAFSTIRDTPRVAKQPLFAKHTNTHTEDLSGSSPTATVHGHFEFFRGSL